METKTKRVECAKHNESNRHNGKNIGRVRETTQNQPMKNE